MQTTINATTPEGRVVVGWLHRASPGNDTLVVLCHGHNSDGTRGRFIEMAKWFVASGIDCLRWSVTRKEIAPGILEIPTLTEELSQARAIVSKLRPQYTRVIAAGHSQGGITALALTHEGLADSTVQIMAVANTHLHTKDKVPLYEAAKNAAGIAPFIAPDAKTYGYTREFFTDYAITPVEKRLQDNAKPILFILAHQDESVTPSEVRAGFEITGGEKELFEVEGGHRFSNEIATVIAKKISNWISQK